MRRILLTITAMTIATTAIGCASSPAESATKANSLREAAGGRYLIGAAIMSSSIDDPPHADLIARNFDSLTAENEMKPISVQPTPGHFNVAAGDKLIAFAEANGMKVIGHTLLWHNQSPAFLFADANGQPLSREQALVNLKTHILTIAGHYRGRVLGWDVVNEAISDREGEYLRSTPALRAIGDDYIIKAFEYAHEADPTAELYYNDYSNEGPAKLEKTLRLIRELRSAGVRIDGVGMQGHWLIDRPSAEVIDNAIAAYKAEGLKVVITELDVDPLPRRRAASADLAATEQINENPYVDGLPEEVQEKLAARYAELFAIFDKHADAITRVTFWGTHDGSSWLNNFPVRGRTNHALLWDRQMQPKPAFQAVLDELTSP